MVPESGSLMQNQGDNVFIGGSERFWLIGDPNNNGKAMFPETVLFIRIAKP